WAGASAPSEMTASLVPTSTVSPSGTRISESTPATGEGTSESTLSVETSNSTSSSATGSPTCFIQRVIVPSVTVSPNWGMVMSANVQTSSGQGEHGLAERLRQGGVRLDEVGNLVRGGLPVDGQVGLAQLLGHPGADHVDAQDPPGLAVGPLLADHLDETLGLADDEGSSIAPVGILLGHHVETRLSGRLLGKTGEGHLRVAVDTPRHLAVVDGYDGVAQDLVDDHDRFREAHMRQGGRVDEVPGGEHARLPGLHVLVHFAEVDRRRKAIVAGSVPGHRDRGPDLDAALLERAEHHLRHVLVASRQD